MIETFIEVTLKRPDDFLLVRETLTRMGVTPPYEDRVVLPEKKKLYQSAHILHKKQRFYIVHFKQMFALDGKETTFTEEDRGRLNRIAHLLSRWGLVTLVNPEMIKEPLAPINEIKVIPHKEKAQWELIPKYSIGRKRPS